MEIIIPNLLFDGKEIVDKGHDRPQFITAYRV